MQALQRLPLKQISVNIATTNGAAYALGEQIGVAVKITDASLDSGVPIYIKGVSLINKTSQATPIQCMFFNALPTVASADKAPVNIADAELVAKFVGGIEVVAGDWNLLANNAICTKVVGAGIVVAPLAKSKDIWLLLMAKAAFTFGSVQDLVVKLDIEQG